MSDSHDQSQLASFRVESADAGKRLDVFLTERNSQYSRVAIRRAITAGAVQVDGRSAKASYRLNAAQQVTFSMPDLPKTGPDPEPIELDILYEDEHLVAVNKPPRMVVHPSKGHWSGTLAAALAYRFEQLSTLGGADRPGIVHRLDRDTSGVIVVARSDAVHQQLAAQFEARTTQKEYLAIVCGGLDRDRDRIDQPIGVHPYQREKMAIRANHSTSREAVTFFEVQERFRGFVVVRVQPKTGRTHQIRLHLAHIGCPVLCDRLYGGRSRILAGEVGAEPEDAVLLDRQALHAARLTIVHPVRREPITFEAPVPDDLQAVWDALRVGRPAVSKPEKRH